MLIMQQDNQAEWDFLLWQQIGFTSSNTLDVYWMIGELYK